MNNWVVLVPLKPLDGAKSRLTLPHPLHRPDVVRRMAEVVVATALEVRRVREVVLVTAENWDQTIAPALVVGEPAAPGLNAALSHAAAAVRDRWPDRPVATLPADVAAMTARELDACLVAASHHSRAVLADHGGTGTVLLTAAAGVPLDPHFGRGSRRAHVRSGAVDLTDLVEAPLMRRDIDTPGDLAALRQHIGRLPALEAALRRAGWGASGPAAYPADAPALVRVQRRPRTRTEEPTGRSPARSPG